MSKIAVILIIILITIIVFIYYPYKLKTKKIIIDNLEFTIEIASTPRQLTQGLSNRKELCQNCGMLFVFPNSQVLSFWMKDTLIPLDMIFIDKDNTITNIITAQVGDLSIKNSTTPAKYCLELNSGRATQLNLKSGDTINL